MKINFKIKFSLFEWAVLILGIAACLTLGVIFKNTWYIFIYAIFCVVIGVLNSKGHILVYPLWAIAAAIYIYMSVREKYWGEIILNTIVIYPFIIYGFINWLRHKNGNIVEPAKLNKKSIVLIFVAGAVLSVGYYFILRALGTSLAWVNAISSLLCICATILMSMRSSWQLIAWTLVEIPVFALWIIPFINSGNGSYMASLPSIICYAIMGIYGFIVWNKSASNPKNKRVSKADNDNNKRREHK